MFGGWNDTDFSVGVQRSWSCCQMRLGYHRKAMPAPLGSLSRSMSGPPPSTTPCTSQVQHRSSPRCILSAAQKLEPYCLVKTFSYSSSPPPTHPGTERH